MVSLILQTYRRRLRGMVATARTSVAEEILIASHRIADDRLAVWRSEKEWGDQQVISWRSTR